MIPEKQQKWWCHRWEKGQTYGGGPVPEASSSQSKLVPATNPILISSTGFLIHRSSLKMMGRKAKQLH
uniref:Uncharacterized protein n=1 Tax=Romanomermis culicivorax TaxID=13658 RepID=A0A915IWC2_ROMCU